ncbi:PEP-CTERM sorting domain-containing protein [Cerasicoccus maritimus]|uniref:PEP-CTERM sorting domain-containing protein n=1 Tax=Cerasicoccus maritimus TaxID=490089 RepID=UPI00285253B9|nr:PEP-CTERM sorting domain-containing protein [Cerasicoccus maritimus]
MRIKQLTPVTLLLAASINVSAIDISLSVAGASSLQDSSSSFLSDGSVVWIGSFDTGFDISANVTNFSVLSANFGYFDDSGIFQGSSQMLTTTIFNPGGSLPGTFAASGTVEDAGGTQPAIYVWAFNNSVASSATEYGIFQMPNLVSGEVPSTSQSLDFAADLVATWYGTFNSETGIGQLQAVPEPSTYALLLGVATLGWVFQRRRLK